MLENNITIMKYRLEDKFLYEVLDKWDEADEVLRLDMMINKSNKMALMHGDKYEQLWIKNTPII